MTVQERVTQSAEHRVLRLRVRDFVVLADSGAFADFARAELLDGEIWTLNAIHSRHARIQAELQGQLWEALRRNGSDLQSYIAPSVAINDTSLPEPDLAIAQPHDDGFLPLEKVRLVVEVADTTLQIDLGRKLRLYAMAGIAEYWIVDVNARVIHQMWRPEGERFDAVRQLAFGHELTSTMIPALKIATDTL
jgi:Uma2 family endonuclease